MPASPSHPLARNSFSKAVLGRVAMAAWAGLGGFTALGGAEALTPGWGIDSCIVSHVAPDGRAAYIALLKESKVTIVRDRMPSRDLAQLKNAGLTVFAFAAAKGPRLADPANQLPEDLLEVFEASREMARSYGDVIDAWEMIGEPDVGYCRDLPDRMAAYQKAEYLGIKAGLAEVERSRIGAAPGAGRDRASASVPVAIGALALPPGPWLERARRNGLLDYTDAYNFHFYGNAADLTGVVRAHAALAYRPEGSEWTAGFQKNPGLWRRSERTRALPLWITECGMNNASSENFQDPARRQIQAEFVVDTARVALAQPRVSVFMPFILTWENSGFALTLPGAKPLPAWTAYAEFTRSHPWPARPITAPADPSPVVAQWMPDNATCVPHKVSGTYRFRPNTPLRGEIRFYNLSDQKTRVRWRTASPSGVTGRWPASQDFELGPGEVKREPVELQPARAGYFQSWIEGDVQLPDGRHSGLFFGVERAPAPEDFSEQALRLEPLPGGHTRYPLRQEIRDTHTLGAWQGMNGVKVLASHPGGGQFEITQRSYEMGGDPIYQPMAMVGIRDLPREGFLILRLGKAMAPGHMARVDLVDDLGQRFTIWENFGLSYTQPRGREVWLNLRDFHAYIWGHCSDHPVLRPERIRELQLRFYPTQIGDRFDVELLWRQARPSPSAAGTATK